MLVESDVEELARAILHRIPQQSQQILGRQTLKAVDLLDLPRVSKNFPHRLTYPDVAADNKNIEELLQRVRYLLGLFNTTPINTTLEEGQI